METYLMMLYVSLDQERALKAYFQDNGWPFCKPDLSTLTDRIGPLVTQTYSPDISSTSIANANNATTGTQTEVVPKSPVSPCRNPSSSSSSAVTPVHSHRTRTSTGVLTKPAPVELGTRVSSEPSERQDDPTNPQVLAQLEGVDTEGRLGEELRTIAEEVYASIDRNPVDLATEEVDIQAMNISASGVEGPAETEDESTITVLLMMGNEGDTNTISNVSYLHLDSKQEPNPSLQLTDNKPLNDDQMGDSVNDGSGFLTIPTGIQTSKKKQDSDHMCDQCGKGYINKSSLDRHRKSHIPGINRCSACSMFFESEKKWLEHNAKHHPGMCLCPVCGGGFTRQEGLRKHMIALHPKQADAKYPCTFKDCTKAFDSMQLYMDHMNKHKGLKPYTCKFCSRKFHRRQTWQIHTSRCPNGGLLTRNQSKMICTLCDKVFMTKGALHNHTVSIHQNKRFVCSCGKVFKYRPGLINHQRKQHPRKKTTE